MHFRINAAEKELIRGLHVHQRRRLWYFRKYYLAILGDLLKLKPYDAAHFVLQNMFKLTLYNIEHCKWKKVNNLPINSLNILDEYECVFKVDLQAGIEEALKGLVLNNHKLVC